VSGPSGVGKSSVLSVLRELRPDIYFSISVTTRPPRPGEVEGAHYHFIDAETFQKMVDAGDLLEHAHYAGNDYGTPRGPVLDALAQGRPAVLEIELQGARQVKTAMPEAQLVMLVPPSWEELVDRLTGRGTENPDVVDRRLEVAREELAAAGEFEAVLVNSDVRTTAQQLVTLVVGAGHESAVPSD
jgi:guanylate kinase